MFKNWFKKNHVVPNKPTVAPLPLLKPVGNKVSRLMIVFTDGIQQSFQNSDISDGYLAPWKDFVKWYLSRLSSENYVMQYKEGQQLIKRADIKYYRIDLC
jgi:hypothetical protein